MPPKAARICSCGRTVAAGAMCVCVQAKKRQFDAARPTARQRGYDSRWDTARKTFLARRPACARCGAPATVVDHITPHRGDQRLFWDTSNWQPLCAPCHNSWKQSAEKSGSQAIERHPIGSATTPATIVCGPPGSGKSTFIDQHRRPGDLIVDMDALFMAITGAPIYDKPTALLPFACEARDAMINRLLRPSEVRHAWIIRGAPRADERAALASRLNARVVVAETPARECLRRIALDPRRADKAELWRPLIEQWWSAYTRRDGDQVVTP